VNLIGLIGKAGSGKTYAASYLVENHDYVRRSFAAPLKEMALVLGLTHEQVYGEDKEEPTDWLDGVTARYIMQTLGKEWGRDMICDDLWVRIMKQKLAAFNQITRGVNQNVVIDDVRFANEVDMIREMGGKIIKIRADTNIKAASPSAQHASEKVMGLGCDVTIENHFDDTFIPSLMRQL
jgi:hypothetical protein